MKTKQPKPSTSIREIIEESCGGRCAEYLVIADVNGTINFISNGKLHRIAGLIETGRVHVRCQIIHAMTKHQTANQQEADHEHH